MSHPFIQGDAGIRPLGLFRLFGMRAGIIAPIYF